MLKFIYLTIMLTGLLSDAAAADELVWGRRGTFERPTEIRVGQDGELYCVGCDPERKGAILIVRQSGIVPADLEDLTPWMSTLWVVLFRQDTGTRCAKGEWFAASLNTHRLEKIDTSQFGCDELKVSVTEHGLGMFVTMSGAHGRKAAILVN